MTAPSLMNLTVFLSRIDIKVCFSAALIAMSVKHIVIVLSLYALTMYCEAPVTDINPDITSA